MKPRHSIPPSLLRLLRRSWLPLALLVLLAPIALLDALWKAGPLPAYVPPEARAIVALTDIHRLLESVGETPALAAARDDLQADLAETTLQIRRITGIRPTATRARIWLGDRILFARSGDDTGFCVRPGLLMRARLALGWHKNTGEGIRAFGDYFYTWRDGVLIGGTSRDYVAAAKTAPAAALTPPGLPELTAPALIIVSRGDVPFTLRCSLPAGLPPQVDGVAALHINQARHSLELPGLAPPALATATASSPADLRALFEPLLAAALENGPLFLQHLAAAIPRDFADAARNGVNAICDAGDRLQTAECSVMLLSVDTRSTPPVPTAGFIMRVRNTAQGAHPLASFIPAENAMPFEWSGISGTLVPILGEKVTLCLAARGNDWLAATTEPAMAKIAAAKAASETTPDDADAVITVDLVAASATLESLLMKAATLELLPGMNARDAQALFAPRLAALGRLGALNMRLHSAAQDEITLKGELVLAPVETTGRDTKTGKGG